MMKSLYKKSLEMMIRLHVNFIAETVMTTNGISQILFEDDLKYFLADQMTLLIEHDLWCDQTLEAGLMTLAVCWPGKGIDYLSL